MPFYLVVHQAHRGHQTELLLNHVLTSSSQWAHYISGVYIVERTENIDEFRSILMRSVDTKDSLLIMEARRPVSGNMPADFWSWCLQHLPKQKAEP